MVTLTIREIQAVAYKYFAGAVIKDGLKKEVVRHFTVLIRKNPAGLGPAGSSAALAASEEQNHESEGPVHDAGALIPLALQEKKKETRTHTHTHTHTIL